MKQQASTERPGDQPAVMEPPAVEGIEKFRLGRFLPEDLPRFARMWRALGAVGFGQRLLAHAAHDSRAETTRATSAASSFTRRPPGLHNTGVLRQANFDARRSRRAPATGAKPRSEDQQRHQRARP